MFVTKDGNGTRDSDIVAWRVGNQHHITGCYGTITLLLLPGIR